MANQGFGEAAERLRRVTVQVRDGRRGMGSGVVWGDGRRIVSNAHVARGSRATVETWDGRELVARVERRDPRRDLALLSVEESLAPAALGDSDRLRVGELVLAVGNPLGFVGALTTGVVHSLGPVRGLGTQPWVRAAVRLAPGNSGGPLADAAGSVVGINTMVMSGGLALAIPSRAVVAFVTRPEASGPWLGVTVRPVPEGLLVLEVAEGSPAERSSLLPGDLLVGAGGQQVQALDALQQAIDAHAGRVLRVQFRRGGGAVRELSVALQPAGAKAA